MALEPSSGYVAGAQDDASLPIFDVQKVQLRFEISADFVAAQVANNVLILALSTGKILRFDLDNAEDIDDIDLPKRPAEVGVIRKLFLDPSASHLIVSTTLGENYYLHTQSRQPKPLSRLKGVHIESVAWNPSQPTASTREILVGSADGNVYETYIEPSTEFYRREEKYVKNVYNAQDGAVVGIYAEILAGRPDTRRVMIATHHRLLHFTGRTGRQGTEGSGSIYSKLFESESPAVHEIERAGGNAPSLLAISPDSPDATPSSTSSNEDHAYAWLSTQGVFHGRLLSSSPDPATLGRYLFRESKLLPTTKLLPSQPPAARGRSHAALNSIALTQFHILALVEGRLLAVNRLDETLIYSQPILEPGQRNLGLFADHQKNTYWLFTSQEIFEVVVTDEARDVWSILLKQGQYESAQRYAKTAEQKDAVASATGQHLMAQRKFNEAAVVLGRSTKAFEDVALTFIDKGEQDALRRYLLTKLANLKRSFAMQRTMLASWLVELYMAKLNELDDTITTKAELNADDTGTSSVDTQKQLPIVRKEYQDLCTKYQTDLDRKTVYEIISAHGREEELLFYANVIDDFNYILSYWVQRERWEEAMSVLKKQTDVQLFYRYATVLMSQTPIELVEVLMRQADLDPKKIIPALLNYNHTIPSTTPLSQNQAIRYLLFCINHTHSTDPAIHNTLISLYASAATKDETALLAYLEAPSQAHERHYDPDFALRLCIAHQRVRACVHIYTTMKQYASAVDLALKHNEIDLAADVADTPGITDPTQRKKLWLKIAKKVIGREKGIKAAMDFLKRCGDLLRIEDLIPFFPDFIVIDDFKEEICAALEDYSRRIDELKREMDESAATAQHIQADVKALDERYAIVEPGERCWKCRLPLLMRQFFVFPCQHAFHADCLGEMVMGLVGMGKGKRIRELQREIGRGVALGKRREGMVRELDGLVAGACVLCGDAAVRGVDEPFVTEADDVREWAV
ncbi:Pep3/Vps18/deep orange family-domain-containing protein [Neohortaea acidophila]|uniref:Pep3/Vps18/deep orange family-domain-containing protein n=1 Tax=Neohortaea acidophila TaxID=245834 RepID=A0A6A6PXA6_9PEZI|nr:Pep3/Vps18/deep orange family-domain-containing protein [Neohortaea acidophila]KAF2484672.1 Pep3/Vps18/deep orange family-domain-containing protein [Neohortaea acidophila]